MLNSLWSYGAFRHTTGAWPIAGIDGKVESFTDEKFVNNLPLNVGLTNKELVLISDSCHSGLWVDDFIRTISQLLTFMCRLHVLPTKLLWDQVCAFTA